MLSRMSNVPRTRKYSLPDAKRPQEGCYTRHKAILYTISERDGDNRQRTNHRLATEAPCAFSVGL